MRYFALLVVLLLASSCATSKTKEFKNSLPTKAEMNIKKANHLLYKGQPIVAERRLKSALKTYQKEDDVKAEAKIYNQLASIAVSKGDFKEAELFASSARTIAEMEGYADILFNSKINQASIALGMGDTDTAKLVLEGVSPSSKQDLAELENLRGLIHLQLGEYDKAEEKFLAVSNMAEVEELSYFKSTALSNLGTIYLTKEENQKALVSFKKALAIDKAGGRTLLIADNLHLVGKAYEALSDFQNAIYFYDRALHINKQLRIKGRADVDEEAIERVTNKLNQK